MKHLKSTINDLRKLFESSITVKDIAEPFASFDASSDVSFVKKFMVKRDYDIIGVRKDGLIQGYAIKQELLSKTLEKYIKPFKEEELLDERASLNEVFDKLECRSHLFILVFGQIGGIVTRGDLQKVPVRMWLFGLVSLIEMQLLRIINEYYINFKWKAHIKKDRLVKAKEIYEERRNDDTNIGLTDCLQFADKYTIILNDDELRKILSLENSKTKCRKLFKDLRKLRDKLAHVQNLITGKWEEINILVKNAEQLLEKFQQFSKP
jgi:hypothetical protein